MKFKLALAGAALAGGVLFMAPSAHADPNGAYCSSVAPYPPPWAPYGTVCLSFGFPGAQGTWGAPGTGLAPTLCGPDWARKPC
jgi:hypothetical protein